jgi:hypothetical protein
MADDKTYCKGSGKVFKFQNGGEVINLSVVPAQLVELLEVVNKQRGKEGYDPTEYLQLNIAEKREVGKYGDTHYAYVRPFKPSAKGGSSKKSTTGNEDNKLPWD